MACRIAGVVPAVHRDPELVDSLHEGHRRIVILAAAVEFLLLEDRPEAERSDPPLARGRDRGGSDQSVAAIGVEHLRQPVDDQPGLAVLGNIAGPQILARSEPDPPEGRDHILVRLGGVALGPFVGRRNRLRRAHRLHDPRRRRSRRASGEHSRHPRNREFRDCPHRSPRIRQCRTLNSADRNRRQSAGKRPVTG